MKILLTNNIFYPYQRGGAETVVRLLAETCSLAGHEVVVVALKPKGHKDIIEDTPKGYKIIYWPSDYYRLNEWKIGRRLLWHLPDWLGLRHLKDWLKVLRSFQPDLVIANNLTGLGFSLHFCCRRLKIASVQIFHDLQYLHPSGLLIIGQEKLFSQWPAKFYQQITANWLSAAKLFVSPSKWLINYHHQCGWLPTAKWLQLANPISLQLAATYRLPDNLRQAVFVGQLTEAKGILWLADQWADFNRRLLAAGLTEAELTIIGDGPLMNELQTLAKNDRRLILLGRLDNEQVAAKLQAADVLLLPSFCYENWPTILLEAAAAGCPAIASSHGGGGELAEKLNYLTFTAGNLDSLLTAWQTLAQAAAKMKVWPASEQKISIKPEDYWQCLLTEIKKSD